MNRGAAHRLLRVGTAVFLLFLSQGALAAPRSASIEEARRRFDEGVAAYDAGKYEAARVAFAQAYALEPLPELLINLGHSELKTNRLVEGARHISKALRDAEIGLGERRAAERALKDAERSVARVKIGVNVDGATLIIDGEDIGTSPMIYAWHLDPGEHRVRASKEGYESDEQVLGVSKGQVKAVQLRIAPVTGARPAPLPSAAQPEPVLEVDQGTEEEDDGPALAPILIGSGLTVAGATVGVLFTLDAKNKRTDRDTNLEILVAETNNPNPCASGTLHPSQCAVINEVNTKARTSQTLGIVGFAVGGAALIGTVIYLALPHGNSSDSAALDWAPVLGPKHAGLQLTGAF